MFSNPLSYAGYPPGVTGTPTTQNTTVRAATATEAATGTLEDVYISPATAQSATALDFASPPVLGFGSTTPRPVHATDLTVADSIVLDDAVDIELGTTTGTKIGTATTEKLGFFNATPIVQPVTTTDIKVALVNLGLLASGASPLDLGSAALGSGTHTFADGTNIVFNTTTGTKIGTDPTQKLSFFNATPIVQPANTTDIKTALVNLGLLATGGATPLNLNGGALTAASASLVTSGATIGVDSDTAAGTGVAGRFTSSAATISAVQLITGSIQVPATSVAGASPVENNVRTGQASFTDIIANGAYGTLTVTNSLITAASVLLATASCTTANSAVQIVDIVPGSGTVAFRVFNAGSASTDVAININFWVLN